MVYFAPEGMIGDGRMRSRVIPYEGQEGFCFISYCQKDAEIVFRMVEGMSDQGCRIWYDAGIPIGSEFTEEIAEKIIQADVFATFLSNNYMCSDFCRAELNFALLKKKKLIILYLEQVKLTSGFEMRLSMKQSIALYQQEDISAVIRTICTSKIMLSCIGVAKTQNDWQQFWEKRYILNLKSTMSLSEEDARKYINKYRRGLAGYPNQTKLNITMAFCFLKLGMFDKALPYFEKAMEDDIDNAEAYFCTGICLLGGKRPFLLQKAVIRKIEEYVSAAVELEPKGIYYYFVAYIKYDFYERKCYRTSPTSKEALALAKEAGLSKAEAANLDRILSVNWQV